VESAVAASARCENGLCCGSRVTARAGRLLLQSSRQVGWLRRTHPRTHAPTLNSSSLSVSRVMTTGWDLTAVVPLPMMRARAAGGAAPAVGRVVCMGAGRWGVAGASGAAYSCWEPSKQRESGGVAVRKPEILLDSKGRQAGRQA
jgi:hypothetical protein